MSTCNSVNLVKESGLKTILSFCKSTQKVLQNNVAIISLPLCLTSPSGSPAAGKWLVAKAFPCFCCSGALKWAT